MRTLGLISRQGMDSILLKVASTPQKTMRLVSVAALQIIRQTRPWVEAPPLGATPARPKPTPLGVWPLYGRTAKLRDSLGGAGGAHPAFTNSGDGAPGTGAAHCSAQSHKTGGSIAIACCLPASCASVFDASKNAPLGFSGLGNTSLTGSPTTCGASTRLPFRNKMGRDRPFKSRFYSATVRCKRGTYSPYGRTRAAAQLILSGPARVFQSYHKRGTCHRRRSLGLCRYRLGYVGSPPCHNSCSDTDGNHNNDLPYFLDSSQCP